MKYTTSTISSRMVMVKVKARQPVGNSSPPLNRNDSSEKLTDINVKAAPLRFNRASSVRVIPSAPALWWENWKTNTLIITFTLLLLAGIYFLLTQQRSPAENRTHKFEPAMVSAPGMINIRPMGMSSTRASTYSGSGQSSDGAAGGSFGAPVAAGGSGGLSANRNSGAANDASTRIAVDHGAFDGRSKLILPADVSGACNVGESGVLDLAGCLSRNGARAEK